MKTENKTSKYLIDYLQDKIVFKIRNQNKINDEETIGEVWVAKGYTPKDFGIKKNAVIIDIGAHIGAFTVYAAKCASEGKVYGYEPYPENFKLLKENCNLNNLKNVCLFNCGVYKKKGKAKLFVNKDNASHSLYQKFKDSIPTKCTTLEDIFESNSIQLCNFLKLDCEGAECDILFNTPKSYFDKMEKIALEYHGHIHKKRKLYDMIKLLSKRGFRVKIKQHASYDGMLYLYAKKGTQGRLFSEIALKLKNCFQAYIVDKTYAVRKTYKRLKKLTKRLARQKIEKIDETIGKIGIFIKHRSPRLYLKLKRIKNGFGLK